MVQYIHCCTMRYPMRSVSLVLLDCSDIRLLCAFNHVNVACECDSMLIHYIFKCNDIITTVVNMIPTNVLHCNSCFKLSICFEILLFIIK